MNAKGVQRHDGIFILQYNFLKMVVFHHKTVLVNFPMETTVIMPHMAFAFINRLMPIAAKRRNERTVAATGIDDGAARDSTKERKYSYSPWGICIIPLAPVSLSSYWIRLASTYKTTNVGHSCFSE